MTSSDGRPGGHNNGAPAIVERSAEKANIWLKDVAAEPGDENRATTPIARCGRCCTRCATA